MLYKIEHTSETEWTLYYSASRWFWHPWIFISVHATKDQAHDAMKKCVGFVKSEWWYDSNGMTWSD